MTILFNDFDFKLLDAPEFKEDSVREEIVAPLLKELGYSASSEHKIIRSKNLTHPFVYIGTTQRKINIIPDYLLQVKNKNAWILDAKAPNENIKNGNNVEQAYSYAIHKDIRVDLYALCNGMELIVFHISKVEPILHINLVNLNAEWDNIYKVLSPAAILNPHMKNYKPDLGLHLLKIGARQDTKLHFVGAWVNFISRVEDNLYSLFSGVIFGDNVFAASFDFDDTQYKDLLLKLPNDVKGKIEEGLRRYPYHIFFPKEESFEIVIEAKFSNLIHSNEGEDYMPLTVVSFSPVITDE